MHLNPHETRTEVDDDGIEHVYSTAHHFGISHALPLVLRKYWRRKACVRDWHLWDEVRSGPRHYLVCDACELMVHIDKIEIGYVE